MEDLVKKLMNLKNSRLSELVNRKLLEFEETGKEKQDRVFSELCFCLLTANFQAEKCIQIQKEMGRDFLLLPEKELAEKLKKAGHRFWPQRAKHIVSARECSTELCALMKKNGKEMRKWLVKNINGLGMKEASHFLRNIGYKDVAIIDFHILDLLEREKIIEKPKTLTAKKYVETEKLLENIACRAEMNLAELDLYLWYLETGKVLK